MAEDVVIVAASFTQGLYMVKKALEKLPQAYGLAMNDFAEAMRDEVIGRTPKDTTALMNSWSNVQKTGKFSFSFGTDLPYALILEDGLYTGVGPRTVAFGGGIYSQQAPGGMIGPLLEDEKTRLLILDYLVEQIEAVWNKL